MSPRGGLTVISGGGSTENNSQTSTPNTENNNMKTQADVAADKIIHPPNMSPQSKFTSNAVNVVQRLGFLLIDNNDGSHFLRTGHTQNGLAPDKALS